MTFAIMALLLGGLTLNANAQDKKVTTGKQTKQNVSVTSKKADDKKKAEEKEKLAKAEDWTSLIKEFEVAVDQTVKAYEKMQATGGKADPKEFNKYLAQAEGLQARIDKAKEVLDRTQSSRFAKAKEKLSKVYKKG